MGTYNTRGKSNDNIVDWLRVNEVQRKPWLGVPTGVYGVAIGEILKFVGKDFFLLLHVIYYY